MKVVILILVALAVVFAVGAWASFSQPKPAAHSDPQKEAKSHKPSGWEKAVAWLFRPKGNPNPLKKSVYHAGEDEVIGTSEKTRQVKLRITRREGCTIPIEYNDNAPHDKTLANQKTQLPRSKEEGDDDHKDDATLILMTTGGSLHFRACTQQHKNGCPARIEVVK